MKHTNKKIITLFASSLLIGCANDNTNIVPRIKEKDEEPKEVRKEDTFLVDHGFNDDNKVTAYQNPSMIREHVEIRDFSIREYDVIKTSDDYKAFQSNSSIAIHPNDVVNCFKDLPEESFDDYDLIISPTLSCTSGAFSYTFKNMYLVDGTIYIHFFYNNYFPPGTGVTCDMAYQVFTCFISKSLTYTSIKSSIQNEADLYR